MFLQQLFESIDKRHAAFAFGRMNPPTLGHGQLIDTVANAAAGGDYFVFVSQTQDRKKNPLDYATKIKFVKAMFPKHAGHIVQEAQLKTIMQIAHWLYKKGYRSVTFVAGSDRIEDFTELLNKYNGNGQEGDAGYYKFDTINVVSSGDRDPDAEGLAGVSATAARSAAAAGNLEQFAQATGAGELSKPLYDAVRQGMLLGEGSGEMTTSELRDMYNYYVNVKGMSPEEAERLVYTRDEPLDEHIVKHGSGYRLVSKKTGKNLGDFPTKAAAKKHEREVQYFKHMKENASGYIPKNKKEAKDPRWSNALTVDVHPDTPNKNMKALRLI